MIADLYETDEENAEKNANKIKALRIAAATVDTISGAIGAFMQASETIPPPYGQIVGALEAATITAIPPRRSLKNAVRRILKRSRNNRTLNCLYS